MKKLLFFIIILEVFYACENRNIDDFNKRDQNNDTISISNDTIPTSNDTISTSNDTISISNDMISSYVDLFGMWEICNYVNYSNDSKIDFIDIVSPSNNGKSMVFERISDSEDIFLTLLYANILSTYCSFGDSNSINIRNEWGGTELLDSTGNEDKLITFLDAVDLWVIADNYLYLIYSESQFNYNALCLKKQ